MSLPPIHIHGPYRRSRARTLARKAGQALTYTLLFAALALLALRYAAYYLRNWWQFGGSHRFAMAAAHADLSKHLRQRRAP